LVLVHEPAEEIASVDPGRLVQAGERRSDSWIRRLEHERAVRPMLVVVPDIDPQHLLEVAAAEDQ
jgi:hypothetical protein